FQLKCYRTPKQPGWANEAILDSLGFWPRQVLLTAAQTNDWARNRVRTRKMAIEAALATTNDLTKNLTYANWSNPFANPCFLGWGVVRPIHVYLARKLRKAELWLLSQPRCAGLTPAELGTLLELDEQHAGGRQVASSRSIHTLGLGIDIKYGSNPHV